MDWRKQLTKICADRRSGASLLARKTVRLLARMARSGVEAREIANAAKQISDAHPAMAPLWHLTQLVNGHSRNPKDFVVALRQFLVEMESHELSAIKFASEWLPEGRVFTHSFSSLVFRSILQAHRSGKNLEVVCTASYPGGEGIALAEKLVEAGVKVVLVADLQAFSWLMQSQLMFIGADAWCEDGVVHKVGTHHLASFAHQIGVPVWSIGTSEKRVPIHWSDKMKGEAPLLTRKHLSQDRTLYDLTYWELVTGIVDENGIHQL